MTMIRVSLLSTKNKNLVNVSKVKIAQQISPLVFLLIFYAFYVTLINVSKTNGVYLFSAGVFKEASK